MEILWTASVLELYGIHLSQAFSYGLIQRVSLVFFYLFHAGDNGRSKFNRHSETLDGESSVRDDDEESEAETRDCCTRCPLRAMRKLTWGVVLGGCVALSWAGATHSAKQALAGLHAPYFITWFCSVWNLLLFPIYYLGHLLGAEQRQWPTSCFR